ncbi:hypothetical protein ACIA5D_25405 [Actinoplanes sp. NPDC051513]|uniref:hypothetical protein n=1 Tax=Actinoplanes sp. NPDC051513 TaxID=3363908 RepID=UPI0037BD7BD5
MTEHAPDRVWSGIDIPKTIAGLLAALSAAVIGSYLGVAGTLAGAAVASLIGSVGTEVYQRSIHKGAKKLQGTFTAAPAAVGTPPVAAADTTVALPAMNASRPGTIRWKRVAIVAGALFVLAMGTLTAAELISGRSIADATRGGAGDRSTVSSIFGDDSGKSGKSEKPAPASSSDSGETPSEAPSEQATPTEQETQQPTGTPTDSPTTAPATPDPTGNTETGGTDSGAGSGSDSGSGGGGADIAPPAGSDAPGNNGPEGP